MADVTKQGEAEKAELLHAIFASVCIEKSSPYESATQETRAQRYWKQEFLLVEENWVREHLRKFDMCKSMAPDGIHPWVLRELVDT